MAKNKKKTAPAPPPPPPPTRFLFLDFDGVLNSRQWVTENREDAMVRPGGSVIGIDPRAVSLVNQIVDRTGCKVVVSSTWRIFNTLPELRDILTSKGFTGQVVGTTPTSFPMGNGTYSRRGDEIHEYLQVMKQLHGNVEFVILDDDSDMGQYMDRLVKTTYDAGLQQQHVDQVVALFSAAPPPAAGG